VVEILKSFEQVAGRFGPWVLLTPGLAAVVLGLVAWLAGVRLQRIVLAVFGAAVGALVSFLVGGPNPPVVVVAAGGGAALGALLPRVFLAVLLAVFGVAIAFTVLAGTHLQEQQGTLCGAQDTGKVETYTVGQSLDVVRAYSIDVADCTKAAARKLVPVNWAILAAVASGLLVLGLLFIRPAGALTCSLLGTALVFTGLILLLIFKGTEPIGRVQQQGAYYGLVLVGMAAFGTLEQLVLCRPAKGGAEGKASHSQNGGSKHAWRGR
jgi:hypothetical protein